MSRRDRLHMIIVAMLGTMEWGCACSQHMVCEELLVPTLAALLMMQYVH